MIRMAAFLLLAAMMVPSTAYSAEKILVFAAASLKDVIEEAASQFKIRGGGQVVASFAASSVLAKQIEAGAPAQIFISADLDWINYLEDRKLLVENSRKLIAGNALIIATQPRQNKSDIRSLLTSGRFAMGDPTNVPAGKYAKTALETLGLWAEAKNHAIFTENVRVALQYAALAEVDASIVYASDRSHAAELVEAYRFPASSHPPILYPAALVAGQETKAAREFLAFLASEAGQTIFQNNGFVKAREAVQ